MASTSQGILLATPRCWTSPARPQDDTCVWKVLSLRSLRPQPSTTQGEPGKARKRGAQQVAWKAGLFQAWSGQDQGAKVGAPRLSCQPGGRGGTLWLALALQAMWPSQALEESYRARPGAANRSLQDECCLPPSDFPSVFFIIAKYLTQNLPF